MIATELTRQHRPRYPINCPICGALLGSFYRDGLSLQGYAKACTPRCERLWAFGRHRAHWRELPADLKQIQLATWMLENVTRPQ